MKENYFFERLSLIQTKDLLVLRNKEINAFLYGKRYNLFDFRQKFICFNQIVFLSVPSFFKITDLSQ